MPKREIRSGFDVSRSFVVLHGSATAFCTVTEEINR